MARTILNPAQFDKLTTKKRTRRSQIKPASANQFHCTGARCSRLPREVAVVRSHASLQVHTDQFLAIMHIRASIREGRVAPDDVAATRVLARFQELRPADLLEAFRRQPG